MVEYKDMLFPAIRNTNSKLMNTCWRTWNKMGFRLLTGARCSN